MESQIKVRNRQRLKRAMRVRKQVRGTADKPRLSVCKTNVHISAQLIDDEKGITLVSAGTMNKDIGKKKSKETAKLVGSKIADLAKQKQIVTVVFDRGRHKYHGLIKELAGAAREAGLQF
jgi:large subunit ribosomal protein L18